MNAKTVTISRADGERLSLIGVHHRSLLTSITFDIVGEGDWGDGREFDNQQRHVGHGVCSGKSFIGRRAVDQSELDRRDRSDCRWVRVNTGKTMTHWFLQFAHFHDLEKADRIVRNEAGQILEAHFESGSHRIRECWLDENKKLVEGDFTGEVRQDDSLALSFVFTF